MERSDGWIPAGGTVEEALTDWRGKAATALLLASVLAYLPAIVLLIAGQAPPSTAFVKYSMLGTYVIVVLSGVLRRTDFRFRAGTMLAAAYAMTFVGNIAAPQGPFFRSLPILLPIMTLVLFGVRVERYATAVSVVILLCAPYLNNVPALVGIITTPSSISHVPLTTTFSQSTGLTGALIALMILLEHFYKFLLQSLENLEQEAADRRDAYCHLECEMAARKRLEREAARAGDEERRRLGHQIHDGVCQQLTGALLRSEALTRRLGRKETLAVEDLAALSSVIEEAIDEAHAAAQGLCPLDADAGALAAALRVLAKRTWESSGISCQFTSSGNVLVPDPTIAQHLYRIAQEAVINAVRHARADQIVLVLRENDAGLLLEIQDNGQGMTGDCAAGMGFRTMAYRAGLIEGDFAIVPGLERGMRVTCRVPRGGDAESSDYPKDKERQCYGR